MKFIQFLFLVSFVVTVFGRATDTSESESLESSRSSSSEEMKYNEDGEDDLMKIEGTNSTMEEVQDSEISRKTLKTGDDESESLEIADKSMGKTDLEEFDEEIESDKKEYIQKRADVESLPNNGTESMTEDDMAVMDQFNKTMEADEEESKKNETVLGIDTFGAQGI